MSAKQPATTSTWSPLYYTLFRALWFAALVSNIGTWMQNVGGVWLMTTLTPSPLLIALMQTATSLPIFLVGLPAGALADIVDRRQLLLITQGLMLAAAAGLSITTFLGITTPWLLLGFTFALGLGTALNTPAWQAIVPELVPRRELSAAIALNGVSINLARAVGPAIGGFIVAALGPASVFLLNALSFIGVIIVLYWWQPSHEESVLPAERLLAATRAGLRYVRNAPALQTVLIRTAAFIFFASGLWALQPIVAKNVSGLGAVAYGILLACVGLGAVLGATLLPRIRQKLSLDLLVVSATILFALATVALGSLHNLILLSISMVLAGIAWIAMMTSLNVVAQVTAPAWVRARALGVYQLIFQAGLAIGSAAWGAVADRLGYANALLLSAVGLLVGLLTALHWRFAAGEQLDLSPSLHLAEPVLLIELQPEDGPVLVTLEYRPPPDQLDDFVRTLYALRQIRLRDGAAQWGLFHDPAQPERYVETFLVESWAEHLRQHERMTASDRAIDDHARTFRNKNIPVSHLIAQRPPSKHRKKERK